jgi:hypothetical protein
MMLLISLFVILIRIRIEAAKVTQEDDDTRDLSKISNI